MDASGGVALAAAYDAAKTAARATDIPSAAGIADAVWDEALLGHAATGTAGKKLSDSIAADPWASELPGTYTSGQAGQIVGRLAALDVSAPPSVVSLVNGGLLTVIAGATFDPPPIDDLVIPATWQTAFFTVKARRGPAGGIALPDRTALIQIKVSTPAAPGDGLAYLNAVVPTTAAWGSLALDASAGTATLVLAAAATVLLAERTGLYWDIKTLNSDGSSDVLCAGQLDITLAVTETV